MTLPVFHEFDQHSFGMILADPPWSFKTWTDDSGSKAPSAHYGVMDLSWIKRLPVRSLAAPDSVLVLWAVAPMLDQALEVMAAWGFKFKSAGAWAKQSSTGDKWAFGTGYIFRSAAEFYLIGTKGNPKSAVRDVRNLVVAPVREHSRKPDDLRADLERMYPGVARLELFARQTAPGWHVWGNQTDRFTPGLAAAVRRNIAARSALIDAVNNENEWRTST